MRLWSVHPRYLDAKGLTALWREGLLARKVLRGRTKGYTRHPQLARFRACRDPVAAMDWYLKLVHDEAVRRGYRFERGKIGRGRRCAAIAVTRGQLLYEWGHLTRKLRVRDPERYLRLRALRAPRPHPAFRVVSGGVEKWERVV